MPVKIHERAARTSLILGAIIGLAMALITPPFQVPDEDAHFFRAYQVSTFDMGLENRAGRIGTDLPRALSDTEQLFKSVLLDPSRKADASMFLRALSLNDRTPIFCSPILPYPPAAYVAQAAGMILGRALAAPPIVSFYLARILNLALFLFLTTWAIQWMPVLRWTLALLVSIVFTVQYLSWTVVGKLRIDGVQGRYFIPFAPLLFLLFSNRRICYSLDDHPIARRMLVAFIILVHTVAATMLLLRYYLPAGVST